MGDPCHGKWQERGQTTDLEGGGYWCEVGASSEGLRLLWSEWGEMTEVKKKGYLDIKG